MHAPRPLPFILAATDQGTLIVNHLDHRKTSDTRGFGVGFQLLSTGRFDADEIGLAEQLLGLRRRHHGDGVVALDGGANIGVHTVAWARLMTGWGRVIAVEAQERIYYALAGNIALNNLFNARCLHAALADSAGTLRMPQPDYTRPGSFGSLELRAGPQVEAIGQEIDYADAALVAVPALAIDTLALPRLDLLKLDVEGMEVDALVGARETILRTRPVVLAEHIKAGHAALVSALAGLGYRVFPSGINLLAIHPEDPVAEAIRGAEPIAG